MKSEDIFIFCSNLWFLFVESKPDSDNAKIPSHKFPSSTYSPNWYCADFCKYFSSIIKIQSREKEPFHKGLLTLLTHQHHLAQYYLTVTKISLEIFQVITCTLGVTYNVNVRHIESLIINVVISLAVYKVSLIKFIQEFIVVVGGGIRIYAGKFSK